MTPFAWLLGVVVVVIGWLVQTTITREYSHFAPRLAARIIELAVSLTPPSQRARWREEWMAELEAVTADDTDAAGLAWAASLPVAGLALHVRDLWALGHHEVDRRWLWWAVRQASGVGLMVWLLHGMTRATGLVAFTTTFSAWILIAAFVGVRRGSERSAEVAARPAALIGGVVSAVVVGEHLVVALTIAIVVVVTIDLIHRLGARLEARFGNFVSSQSSNLVVMAIAGRGTGAGIYSLLGPGAVDAMGYALRFGLPIVGVMIGHRRLPRIGGPLGGLVTGAAVSVSSVHESYGLGWKVFIVGMLPLTWMLLGFAASREMLKINPQITA